MNEKVKHRPSFRRLRVFAFDPSLATQLETAVINQIVLTVPWEIELASGDNLLRPGPTGEYLEVVDYDPASRAFYAPVDLDDPYLLAQEGLSPSEGDPQFHQQMVYAVAMTTIGNFERALGRVALWAPRLIRNKSGKVVDEEFVRRLRMYPHALRESNAYYSPSKKALLFGYFPTNQPESGLVPGSMVFTCLSHDIIAHETTHALLDGMHPRFRESTNYDVLALHEAFADIVGIFQHFSNPEVLQHQIARTRGDLAGQNLLGQLAQQFGRAIGKRGALRDALGFVDESGEWRTKEPDPRDLAAATAPHPRGAILVAAVFDAFLMIYKSRIADLLRIATRGTGVLPVGDIHPDLVRRLAEEAAKAARHVLQMCIRALDYCPPVDVTFGDYLRAIITGDADLNPEDEHFYRVAFIDAFRRRGIYPRGIRSLSEDTLRWPTGMEALLDSGEDSGATVLEKARDEGIEVQAARRLIMQEDIGGLFPARKLRRQAGAGEPPDSGLDTDQVSKNLSVDWDLEIEREQAWKKMKLNARLFSHWLTKGPGRRYARAFGITLDQDAPPSVYRSRDGRTPSVEIHSVRTALRRGCKGSLVTELVVEITQRRRGYLNRDRQDAVDSGTTLLKRGEDGDFRFRRGCTILINPNTFEVRRVIRTAGNVADDFQLERVRAFLAREDPPHDNAFEAGVQPDGGEDEQFARLHRLFR